MLYDQEIHKGSKQIRNITGPDRPLETTTSSKQDSKNNSRQTKKR